MLTPHQLETPDLGLPDLPGTDDLPIVTDIISPPDVTSLPVDLSGGSRLDVSMAVWVVLAGLLGFVVLVL